MRKFKTLVASLLLIVVVSLSLSSKASAVWDGTHWLKTDKGWKYQVGQFYFTKWNDIKGSWYYFDKDGYMLHDTYTPDGYYVGSDGKWIANYQPTNLVSDSGVITFEDINLEAAVRKEINKATGSIYKNDVSGLTHLIIRDGNIRTLNGLEGLSNLTSFAIVDTTNTLTDISALSRMPNLKGVTLRSLNLTSNQIINTLKGLKLTGISLYGNNFTQSDKQRLADAVPTAFTNYLSVY